jgi:tetratricopeptide (TPR) repeat protein
VLLHRRIGDALEKLHGADAGPHLAELAYHFFHSAPGGDVEKAIHYAVEAGRRASAGVAHEEAAAHYERALQALDLKPSDDPALRCELLLSLTEAHGSIPAIDRAREVGLQAAEIARSLGAWDKLGRAAIRMGWEFAPDLGFDELRMRYLEEALAAVDPADTALQVRLLARLAHGLTFVDTERGVAYADQAVAVARESGDPTSLAYALNAKQWSLGTGAEDVDLRLALSKELGEVAQKAGLAEFAAESLRNRAYGLLERGDAAGAKRELEVYHRVVKELRNPAFLWQDAALRGMWALLEGRFEEGERAADEAFAHSKRFGHAIGAQIHGIQVARARAEQGRLEEYIPVLESILQTNPNPAWHSRIVQIHAELGHEEEARREFEAMAAQDFADVQRDAIWNITMTYLAEGAAFLRDTRRCEQIYEMLLPQAGQNVMVTFGACNGPVARYLGLLAAALGHFDDAERHFEDALAMNRRLGARALGARAESDYARMLLERDAPGDRERALQLKARDPGRAVGGLDALRLRRRHGRAAAAPGLARPRGAGRDGHAHVQRHGGLHRDDRAPRRCRGAPRGAGPQRDRARAGEYPRRPRGGAARRRFPAGVPERAPGGALRHRIAARLENGAAQSVRVRIGLHTGEAIKDADKFFGKTVIQAFRIADLADGGEILTSSLTNELVTSAGDLHFQAPREVALKGLSGTHRVFPLVWQVPGGDTPISAVVRNPQEP